MLDLEDIMKIRELFKSNATLSYIIVKTRDERLSIFGNMNNEVIVVDN